MLNFNLLKPDTLARIVADIEAAEDLTVDDLNAQDAALIALAENVGQHDAELMIEEAHNR